MNRRNFFATLLAPFVAKALPKSNVGLLVRPQARAEYLESLRFVVMKSRSVGMTTCFMESTARGYGDYLANHPLKIEDLNRAYEEAMYGTVSPLMGWKLESQIGDSL